MAWVAVRPIEMQASNFELNVELRSHLCHQGFLQSSREIPVKEAEVRYEGRLAPAAKCPASGLVRFSKRLRERRTNEKTAKVFIQKINLSQPNGKRLEGGGDAGGLADQFPATPDAAPQQGYVREKFRCAISSAQLADDLR
jgi:hypothetical protein